jgi:hypothetical protein
MGMKQGMGGARPPQRAVSHRARPRSRRCSELACRAAPWRPACRPHLLGCAAASALIPAPTPISPHPQAHPQPASQDPRLKRLKMGGQGAMARPDAARMQQMGMPRPGMPRAGSASLPHLWSQADDDLLCAMVRPARGPEKNLAGSRGRGRC